MNSHVLLSGMVGVLNNKSRFFLKIHCDYLERYDVEHCDGGSSEKVLKKKIRNSSFAVSSLSSQRSL